MIRRVLTFSSCCPRDCTLWHTWTSVRLHGKCQKISCIYSLQPVPWCFYKHCHSIDVEKMTSPSFSSFSSPQCLTTLGSISPMQILDTTASLWDLSVHGCIHSRFMRNQKGFVDFSPEPAKSMYR